jgi:hypothetical protein
LAGYKGHEPTAVNRDLLKAVFLRLGSIMINHKPFSLYPL